MEIPVRIQTSPTVAIELHPEIPGLATVWLTRPDKHNAVLPETLSGVARAQRWLRSPRHAQKLGQAPIRAVLIRGQGASFCSGMDFPALMKRPMQLVLMALRLWSPVENLFQTWAMGWRRLPMPVFAVIEGHCYGAGVQLALGADFRIAHPEARLSFMEMRWGLVPDMGGPTLLRELVRIDIAKDLAMTGRVVSGLEAAELGLVTTASPDPASEARTQALKYLALPPKAMGRAKRLIQRAWHAAEDRALAAERATQRTLMGHAEHRATLSAANRSKSSR